MLFYTEKQNQFCDVLQAIFRYNYIFYTSVWPTSIRMQV